MALGENDTETDNRVTLLLAKFHLPGMLGAADRLEIATLRFYLNSIDGTPAGPVSLWHGGTDNDSDALFSDYENSSYTDTLLDLIQPTDAAPGYYEIDVTSLVLVDYAEDTTNQWVSAFRLQIDEAAFLEDNLGGSYLLTLPRSVNPPELVLTFAVPEPCSFKLLLFAAAEMLCYRPILLRHS